MPRDSHFHDTWLSDDPFRDWMKKKKHDKNAFCKYCQKDINITNGGEAALKRHAAGQKHKDRSPVTIGGIKRHTAEPIGASADRGSLSTDAVTKKTQSSIENVFERYNIINAEIRWCRKVVKSRYSQHSCDEIVELFAVMFPNSEIAKKMTLGRTKCGYIINHGIAPHLNELLLAEANQSPFYVLSFDESLNKHLQRGKMDVLVRFWNNEKTIAESRYLTSEFLGGGKAEQLLQVFEKAVASKLGPTNHLQVSSDGPNVNLLFLQLLEEKRRFNDLPSLLNIGTCGVAYNPWYFKSSS